MRTQRKSYQRKGRQEKEYGKNRCRVGLGQYSFHDRETGQATGENTSGRLHMAHLNNAIIH